MVQLQVYSIFKCLNPGWTFTQWSNLDQLYSNLYNCWVNIYAEKQLGTNMLREKQHVTILLMLGDNNQTLKILNVGWLFTQWNNLAQICQEKQHVLTTTWLYIINSPHVG